MLPNVLLTAFVALVFSVTTSAQKLAIEEYRVRVITKGGNHVRGILDEVTDEYLYLDYVNPRPYHRSEKIPLAVIRKVVIRYNRRKSTLEGAIVGGGLAGFLTIQSSRKNGFRSPIVYGINLAIVAGAGAGLGALIGRNIGPIVHKTVRPFGRTADEASESLRRQLEPFTYTNQSNILNRVPQ